MKFLVELVKYDHNLIGAASFFNFVAYCLKQLRTTGLGHLVPVESVRNQLPQLFCIATGSGAQIKESHEPAFFAQAIDPVLIDEFFLASVIDLGPDQQFDGPVLAEMFFEPLIPVPRLVQRGPPASRIDQHQRQCRIVQKHLMDELILILPAKVPQHHIPPLPFRRLGRRMKLFGLHRPEPHPVRGAVFVIFGITIFREPHGETRFANVTFANEDDFSGGV